MKPLLLVVPCWIMYMLIMKHFRSSRLKFFCCKMATLPVTPKKDGKENYVPKRTLLAKETFAVFISAI